VPAQTLEYTAASDGLKTLLFASAFSLGLRSQTQTQDARDKAATVDGRGIYAISTTVAAAAAAATMTLPLLLPSYAEQR
jgi:hypothetical protein